MNEKEQNKLNDKELRIPKLYNKIAMHYLKIRRITRKLPSIIDSVDDIDIFYDGKNSITIKGSKGSYVGERKKQQIDWKKFVIKPVVKEEETEEEKDNNVRPRRSRKIHKKKRIFRRRTK